MRLKNISVIILLLTMTALAACQPDVKEGSDATDTATQASGKPNAPVTFKGSYSFAPGAKIFQFCNQTKQFWAVDSSAQLELKYSQLITFEQSGTPVYTEVEGYKIKSAATGDAAAYDSTIVVKKVLKLTKDLPADCK
ncbi:hypothetical protein ACFS5N_12290 [Mucilaginibacter ximonensis]|uniref:NlpE C-terminal OB domain-containing protein n=1 Tax=Mucilaginibacter ximonensis TaxID=538021 RepID=A0ABW5YCV3_9SPHI